MICLDCGMKEREEWAMAGNHVCNRITDLKTPVQDGIYKIGKRRYIKAILG